MTTQSSGGSGSGLPGVTSDGLTPGGIKVAGALTAGDPAAVSVPSAMQFNGYGTFQDSPANIPYGAATLYIIQSAPLTDNAQTPGIDLQRSGALNGHDYQDPLIKLTDTSGSSFPVLVAQNLYGELQPHNLEIWSDGRFRSSPGGTTQFQVDGDGIEATKAAISGALGVFGHTPPVSQPAPTLVTSTITDANAKATIKGLIAIINGCGLAVITES